MTKNGPTFPVSYYDFYKTNGQVVVALNTEPSLTRQEFADECDINLLMKRFENRDIGAIMRDAAPPVYYDFTVMPGTLMEYMQVMQDAESAFMTLPAQVRKEFDNSAMAFVDYASNPGNLDQMRKWGLAPPANAPEAPVGVVPAGPAPAPQEPPKAPGGPSTHVAT